MIVGFRDEWLGAFFVIGADGLDARCTGQGDGRAAQTRQRVMQRPHGRDRPDRGSCGGHRCEDSYYLGRLAGEMRAPGLLHRPVSPRMVAPGVAPSPEAHLPDIFFTTVAVNAFCPTHTLQRPHHPQSRLQDRRRCIETGADGSRVPERKVQVSWDAVDACRSLLAERVGFEPTVPLRVQRFSRPSRSTAPAPLHRRPCRRRGAL
jgi:hypothetical protein